MWTQQSFKDESSASLFVVPTPIGNLDDMTYRAVKTLQDVDIIAAEDTRQTKKLLNHFNIKTKLISYHEHSHQTREDELIKVLKSGKTIALVSDAGMPAISDPGSELIAAVIDEEINVIVLPGANAALCALVGSGIQTDEFLFYGFLPRQKKKKQEEVERLKQVTATLILYESPHRLKDTLQLLSKELGNRQITIAREMTKMYEEFVRGSLEEIATWSKDQTFKGEFCLILSGNESGADAENELWWSPLSVKEHVEHYKQEEQLKTNHAIKRVASERSMPRKEVYNIVHNI